MAGEQALFEFMETRIPTAGPGSRQAHPGARIRLPGAASSWSCSGGLLLPVRPVPSPTRKNLLLVQQFGHIGFFEGSVLRAWFRYSHSSVPLSQLLFAKHIPPFLRVTGSLLRGLNKLPPRAVGWPGVWVPRGLPDPAGTLLPSLASPWQWNLETARCCDTGHGSTLPDGCTLTCQGSSKQPPLSPVFCPLAEPQ